MTEAKHQEFYDKQLAKIGRVSKIVWFLLVLAFGAGGWAAVMQYNITALNEKMSKQEKTLEEISKQLSNLNSLGKSVDANTDGVRELKSGVSIVTRSVEKLESNAYTLREAQGVTERLVVLETKLSAIGLTFDEKIARLERLLDRHGSTSDQHSSTERIAKTP